MSTFISLAEKRRSIYHLGNKLPQSKEVINDIVLEAAKQAPSSFNSQSSRVVVLHGDAHQKLWDITKAALQAIVPADAFAATEAKINSFAAGAGTVVYFEDEQVVEDLQAQFPAYAANFPKWSDQAHGITAYGIWLALAEVNIGASLQHYNELIEAAVKAEWNIPAKWSLKAQMPFGSIETPADPKSYIETDARFKTFG
ncbi:nitroreductase family protein [Ignatzschineria sp. LJL83]